MKKRTYSFQDPEVAREAGIKSGKVLRKDKARSMRASKLLIASKKKYAEARSEDQLMCALRAKLNEVTCAIRDTRRDIRYSAKPTQNLEALYQKGCKDLLTKRAALQEMLAERNAQIMERMRAERDGDSDS